MAAGALSRLPSVDRLLNHDAASTLIAEFGRDPVKRAIRTVLGNARSGELVDLPDEDTAIALAADMLSANSTPSLRPVYNLTGTVIHTNLGRAPLPAEAIARIAEVAAAPSNLEYDLEAGSRGDRDVHIEGLLAEITGAEAATIVNNNAAAVLLTLNTFAEGREVIVSRGELVEIGGSFRIPEIMRRAGCQLREVGATNRTHPDDYIQAIDDAIGLVMKVHTSNYQIQGFTKTVAETELAAISQRAGIPFVNDLGSGTLADLTRYGLPKEPTVQEALSNGADLVTFSGDKLLGGPQAGMIVGRRELIERIKKNPMKRALRVDKMTLAAMFEVLKLYRDPETLVQRLPTLRLLARPAADIEQTAHTILPALQAALNTVATVSVEPASGQIGSGALPTAVLPGFACVVTPITASEAALQALVSAFRQLPTPVIGRVSDGKVVLDMRTVEEPAPFIEQLSQLKQP